MPRTRECDFCGADIEPGTGTMLVRTNGTTIHYCSSKCEKNAELGREPRDIDWTSEGRAAAADAAAADAEAEEAAADAEAEEAA
ncbi:MAG: 50S ribosomal protein L24e, partial [Halobacteriales archaeon]